jgi:uncharacterized protein
MKLGLVGVLGLALWLGGCASHSDKTAPIRSALDAGRPAEALKLINEKLEVDSAKQLPEQTSGDNALLLLDRAMVQQSLGEHALSSRDLEVSDKQIEVLDLSRNAADDIGKYLFSDDTGPYKSPAYEKLMINTMNMVNYLARGNLQGARVEARRLAVMQSFIERSEGKGRGLLGLGSYLAGFTFEKSGNADEALRYYDEALAYAQYPSLEEPIRRLAERSPYRTPRIRKLLGEGGDAVLTGPKPVAQTPPAAPAGSVPTSDANSEDDAEILVILGYGRVPEKIARRVPIGLALTYASGFISPGDASTANRLAAQGLVTWVNFPELGKPRGRFAEPRFSLDGRYQPLDGAIAVDMEAKRAWDDAKGAVVASAITRMIARVVAGEAVRQTNDGVVGVLLSLGTQAALTAADTPDTRSWETLPARIAIGRVRVPAGARQVELSASGSRVRKKLNLSAGGWGVANLTVLR